MAFLCPGQVATISTWWLEELRRKIFLRTCYTVEGKKKKSPNTSPHCWTQWEKKTVCASTFPPAWLGRHPQWARKQKARNPGGQEKDAAFPFPLHPTGLLHPSHHPFKPNSFILIKSCQGLSTHHADRACCIFFPSLGNSPVVARGKSSTTKSQNRKEHGAWWLQLPLRWSATYWSGG